MFRESLLYIYSFGSRLDLLGWRAVQCVGYDVESMRLMQAAWREVGVSLCALLHRAIARSDTRCVVQAYTRTCVDSVKLPVCAFIEVYTEGSQDRTHGKVSSTYVYMHKCAEECRIARRSDRTRCTQYSKDVGSNSVLVNLMEMRDHKHGKLKYFKMYAQHGTCVFFSQKSAEIKKNNAQYTCDNQQEFFPSSYS